MHLIYYWRHYQKDMESYRGEPTYRLIQSSPAMLQIEPGESLWAFCLRKSDKVYVPAAELVAESVERLAIPHPEYGEYAVHGDRQRSRYFNIADCPDIESLTRNLDIVARSEALGMSFQGHNGVRAINDLDHESLRNFCVSLRTL